MKQQWLQLCLILLLITGVPLQTVQAEAGVLHTYLPIGSGYSYYTLERFARAAVQHYTNGIVDILIIPITYATDPFNISNGERQQNLTLAESRRSQIESACNAVKLASQTCRVVLTPVLVRLDAYLKDDLNLFVSDIDGMFVLGGDQTIAMQVVANTPFEAKMAEAFQSGAVISGNSAGAAVESLNMIGGFTGNLGPENGFQQGSVDLWLPGGSDPNRRGLSFGMTSAILEQHTFQRGRIARLINASYTTGLLGIGADADTAVAIQDESTLTDVTGATAAIAVDLQTYNAASRFAGPTNSLAIHGVVTHIIPPGGFGYDLTKRRPLVDGKPVPAPAIAGRSFAALHLPMGSYGPLMLAGDLGSDLSGSAMQRFVTLSGSGSARLVVLTLGYAKSTDAQADAKAIAAALQPQVTNHVQWFVVDSKVNQSAVQNAIMSATGILVTAPDQSLVLNAFASVPNITSTLRDAWAHRKVILADNAAAAALGEAVNTEAPPTSANIKDVSMEDFLLGITIQPGLNWIPGITVEPRMVMDRHWGRAYNDLYYNHALLGLGIDVNTAIEFTVTGAQVWGKNTVTIFDGRLQVMSWGLTML